MLAPVATILREPGLRLPAAFLFLFGVIICSVVPYQSLVGIGIFGLSEVDYALVLVCAALVNVIASISLGIISDHYAERRHVAAASLAIYLTGGLAMVVAPGPLAFVLAHVIAFPVGGTIFAQSFTLARLSARGLNPDAEAGVMAAIRAIFALPFLLVLPMWSFAFNHGAALVTVYWASFALSLVMFWYAVARWPKGIEANWQEDRTRPDLRESLRAFGQPALLARVAILGVISGGVGLYLTLVGLAFKAAGRPEGDVAYFVGGIAGAEVPFMLMVPYAQRRLSRTALIAAGTVLYAIHLGLMPLLAGTGWVWLLILPASLGGAAILTLPIAYVQDMMADRPGAGSSLMALQRITGDGACAAAFAIGTALSGYGLAAFIGATMAVAAAFGLWALDRRG